MGEPKDDRVESHGEAGNPSGESEPGLAGDLGLSSERTDPAGGVQGTGTSASSQGRTHGAEPPREEPVDEVHRQQQEAEANTAELPSHDDIRAANPHPRRTDT
ncbi:MAG: hypothetical protein WBQ50_18070 [Nocardioides sp.]